jgi:hypothetical protein
MRVTDPGVDTEIAQLALTPDQDGLSTEIVAFFDETQAKPSQNEPTLSKRSKARIRSRRTEHLPVLKR